MRLISVIAAALACAALCGTAGAQDWKFSSSVNYDTGKYGTTERVDTLYVPFTLTRYYDRADVSVTVPYVRQSSTGQVVIIGGQVMHAGRKTRASASTSAESGLGDILLRAARMLTREDAALDLALAGKVKLPTASESKGLGTGRLDVGAGLEAAKDLSADWTLLADGYYTFIGEPPGVDYRNQLALSLGFSTALEKDLGLTVLYETQNAIVAGNPGPRSLSGTLSWRATASAQYFGGLTVGLSDGSPDLGVSAGFSLKF